MAKKETVKKIYAKDLYYGTVAGVKKRAAQVGMPVDKKMLAKVAKSEKAVKAYRKRLRTQARVQGHRNKPQN